MELMLETLYRDHTLQIWRMPTELFAYVAINGNGAEASRSAGIYPNISVAATNGCLAIDRIVDLPLEAQRVMEQIAQREQQLGGN